MACESDSSPKVSTNGYEYEILDRKGGETPAPGDFVYFHGYVNNHHKISTWAPAGGGVT